MTFREPLVCWAVAQVVLVLPQGSSQLLCVSTGHKEAEVRAGLMCCLDDNSHFIPLRAWVDLPREAGCEPGGGGGGGK